MNYAKCWKESHQGVGVTKPISSLPLFSSFFNIAKTHISYWISRLYLTGVVAAQLRRHLSNMNVIKKSNRYFCKIDILLTEKLTNGAFVTPPLAGNAYVAVKPLSVMQCCMKNCSLFRPRNVGWMLLCRKQKREQGQFPREVRLFVCQ